MASITSVVAFFILLLATFSYSAPIGQEYGTSTPEFELTTNQNMDNWGKPVNMRSLVNDESTRVSVPREDRSSEQNEVTTEDVTLSPRTFEDSSYSPMTDRKDERNYEEYSTNSPTSESSEERSHEKYSSPSSPKMNEKRVYKDSTYPSASESSEEPKREKYSSPSSSKLNEKRVYKDSTNSPKSESSEERNREKYSSPSSSKLNEKRVYKDSTYPSTSGSSEERSREKFSSPSSPKMNEKRVYKDSTYPSTSGSSEERNVQTSSSPLSTELKPKRRVPGDLLLESNEKRTVEDFLYTTLESSTEFNQRAIRPTESESEEVESSTTMDSKNQIKMNKDAEPSSSVHSFGKYTGLLADEQSSTSEYETTNQPDQESTQDSAVQPERLTKTISIIPGKITETKIFANAPSRTSVVIQPVSQEQLSQVQNQAIAEKKKSNN